LWPADVPVEKAEQAAGINVAWGMTHCLRPRAKVGFTGFNRTVEIRFR